MLGFSDRGFVCLFVCLLFVWLHHAACGILVPQPGIEPAPPAVAARSCNHWTAREVPGFSVLILMLSLGVRNL